MSKQLQPSLRPVLLGSILLSMSAACQRAERTDDVDTTTPSQDTTARDAPLASETTSGLENEDQERLERIHVTGKDKETALRTASQDTPLGNGGAAGTSDTAGSAGTAGASGSR